MTDKTLDWKKLVKNKCPQCHKDFVLGLTVRAGTLFHKCGFKISEQRYKEIVSGIVTKQIDEQGTY